MTICKKIFDRKKNDNFTSKFSTEKKNDNFVRVFQTKKKWQFRISKLSFFSVFFSKTRWLCFLQQQAFIYFCRSKYNLDFLFSFCTWNSESRGIPCHGELWFCKLSFFFLCVFLQIVIFFLFHTSTQHISTRKKNRSMAFWGVIASYFWLNKKNWSNFFFENIAFRSCVRIRCFFAAHMNPPEVIWLVNFQNWSEKFSRNQFYRYHSFFSNFSFFVKFELISKAQIRVFFSEICFKQKVLKNS